MSENNNEKGSKAAKRRKAKEKGGSSEDKLGAGSKPLPKATKWIAVTIAVPVLVGGLNYAVQKALDPALDDHTSNGRRSGKPSASPTPTGRAPLDIVVEPAEGICETDWLVPKPADQIDTSVRKGLTNSWADYPPAVGGYPTSPSGVLLTVQGRSHVQVTLTKIEIVVLDRKTPPTGTLLGDACGGPGAYRWLEVDLDRDPPRISSKYDAVQAPSPSGELANSAITPIRFPYKVSASDAESFYIQADTKSHDCAWVARLYWASAGKSGVTEITNNGSPFRTVSTRNATEHCTIGRKCG
jgi:hypothetical protein